MRTSNLLRLTAIVSACTALSRTLGFVREILMAVFFGTSLAKSAFDVAFRIPNLFRRLFGEGALSTAFIPVFTSALDREGVEEASLLANRVATMLAATLTMIVLAGLAIIGTVIKTVDLGARPAAVLPLLAIMLPYMIFICLVALSMAVLNSLRHFTVPAATPVILNIAWILAILHLCPLFGESMDQRIYGVAWGILAAGVIQLLIQAPVLWHHGIRIRPTWHWKDPRVRKVLLLMGPTALGMGVMQINVVMDGVLALFVGPWAPAALTYAERLIYLPLGVFATSLGTVLLPTFSKQAARGERADMARTLGRSVASLMMIVIPATVGLLALSTAITELAFSWKGGRFDATSTALTARALNFYAPGLVTFSLYKLLLPLFYAEQDPRTPLRVGIFAVALNFVLNVTFVLTWPEGYGHAGLACATVIASTFSCIWLARMVRRRIGPIGWPRIAGISLKSLASSLLMAAAARGVHGWVLTALAETSAPGKLVQACAVGSAIVAAVIVYGVGAFLLCHDMLLALYRRVKR